MNSNEKLGLDLLPERKKQSYVEELKTKLSSTISGNQDIQSRDKFTKREIKALWARHLKDLLVPLRNSEFDILVALKVDNICILKNTESSVNNVIQDSATVLQIEVKTYPQGIENVRSDALR